jgi:hypothetical protein
VLARFPARLPELFCHHRVCVQARCKGIGGGSGIASSSPGPSAPPQTRRRRRARRIVAEPSPATRASSLPPRARGRSASRPPLARPTHAREIRFTNNDNGSAGARVAAPGRDALPPASRRATIVPRAELRASDRLPFPSAGTRSRFLRTGREEDKRADDALTGRRLHRGSRVFLVIRCSTTPARAAALPAVTRASSLPA